MIYEFAEHSNKHGGEARKQETRAGFSLIELMITLAIVSILAAIAYPSYRSQVQTTRKAEAQAHLLELAQSLERKYSADGCYNSADDEVPPCSDPHKSYQPVFASTDYYSFSADTLTETTYTLEAQPVTGSSQDGTGALRIDQAGRRWWDENNNGDLNDTGEDDWRRG